MEDAQSHFRAILADDSVFPQMYATFALLMIGLLVIRSLFYYFNLIFFTVIYLAIYLHVEKKLQEVMQNMATSSSYFRRTPYFLLPYFFLLLILVIHGFFYAFGFTYEPSKSPIEIDNNKFKFPHYFARIFSVNNHNDASKVYLQFYPIPSISPDNSLFSIYLTSLLQSLVFFMISSCLKCFLLGSGLVKLTSVRRGMFGVFQRIFILARNMIVLPIWADFFSSTEIHFINLSNDSSSQQIFSMTRRTIDQVIKANKPFWCLSYFAMKCFLQLILLGDLGAVIRDYSLHQGIEYQHVDDKEVNDECVICLDTPFEPVKLTCGHIFCYSCIYRWFQNHDTCPTCRTKIGEQSHIEFSDGYTPLITLFSTF